MTTGVAVVHVRYHEVGLHVEIRCTLCYTEYAAREAVVFHVQQCEVGKEQVKVNTLVHTVNTTIEAVVIDVKHHESDLQGEIKIKR